MLFHASKYSIGPPQLNCFFKVKNLLKCVIVLLCHNIAFMTVFFILKMELNLTVTVFDHITQ